MPRPVVTRRGNRIDVYVPVTSKPKPKARPRPTFEPVRVSASAKFEERKRAARDRIIAVIEDVNEMRRAYESYDRDSQKAFRARIGHLGLTVEELWGG